MRSYRAAAACDVGNALFAQSPTSMRVAYLATQHTSQAYPRILCATGVLRMPGSTRSDEEDRPLERRSTRRHVELTVRARASQGGTHPEKQQQSLNSAPQEPAVAQQQQNMGPASSEAGDLKDLNRQIMKIALPMLVALATDPLAGLIDTAFIGRIGAIELAGMAIALSIFNTVAKFLNVPLVSATTTSVANALGKEKAAKALARPSVQARIADTHQATEPLLKASEAQTDSSSDTASWRVPATARPISQGPEAASQGSASRDQEAQESAASSLRDQDSLLGSSPPDLVGYIGAKSEPGVKGEQDAVPDASQQGPQGLPKPSVRTPSDTIVLVPPEQPASGELKPTVPLLHGTQRSDAAQPDTPNMELQVAQTPTAGGQGPAEGLVASAASAAVFMAAAVGLLEAVALAAVGSHAVQWWGLEAGSQAHAEAVAFLHVRCFTVPFTVMLLALQGVFRGLGNTHTPLMASLAANLLNIAMAPVFIFTLGWGVKGAAAAQGLAQVAPTLFLLAKLTQKTKVRFVGGAAIAELLALLKPSGFLLLRTASVTATFALATSTMAHLGATYAAAHQVAMSLWLATSLLADALAVAAQSLIARFVAEEKPHLACIVADRCIIMGGLLGLIVATILELFRHQVVHIFTTDAAVLSILKDIMPILIFTQPINMLAFVMDGVLFGAGGFKYASFSMAACAGPAVAWILGGSHGATATTVILCVWAGLTTLMVLRILSIFLPYKRRWGPFDKLTPRPAIGY